jgi:hypothetical protein
MKKLLLPVFGFALTAIFVLSSSTPPDGEPKSSEYIVISWNDLGMHCANKDFSSMAVLPPYNNLITHLIKRGNETTLPEVVTTGFSVNYEVPGNTYSVGKTNFWDYEDQLFGVNLPDNIGLTGAGMTGEMDAHGNSFTIEGIPITPYTDANLITEDPFQLALVSAYDGQDNFLASTQIVIPVSNEISCVSSGCHTSEARMLGQHDNVAGYDPNDTPILCASCHSSNALGTPGIPEAKSLSEVIHDKHAEKTNDCYKCHPGSNAQCQRGVMHAAGMVCQDCHGNVRQVAKSIEEGREPWLEEPSCGATNCHGAQYAEEPGKLYRMSKGHGGLYCSTCHGSPHALVPSTLDRDNVQNIALQGYAGVLNNCAVCHGYMPEGAGPHGLMAPDVTSQAIELTAGWAGISSYLIPLEKNVDDIFDPVVEELVLLYGDGGVFWPDESINTLNQWHTSSGYIVKMQADVNLPFIGIKEADKQITVAAGWSIMPVLAECNVSIADLFAAYPAELVLIKEVAGSMVYWPEFGITTLEYLEPGNAYYIYTLEEVMIEFPVCD